MKYIKILALIFFMIGMSSCQNETNSGHTDLPQDKADTLLKSDAQRADSMKKALGIE
jgi:hypothetical protein